MKDSIIVVSGGMDSITLLYDYKDRIALAVSFDYGSNHNAKELPLAEMHCKRLGIPHITIPLMFMKDYFKSSLLEGAEAIPEGNYDEENMKSTVVPFRNGIMLSVACGLAETHHLKHVMMANHSGDHTIYPDCRPGFSVRCRRPCRPVPTTEWISSPLTPTSQKLISHASESVWVSITARHGAAIRGVNTIVASAARVVSGVKRLRRQASMTQRSMTTEKLLSGRCVNNIFVIQKINNSSGVLLAL